LKKTGRERWLGSSISSSLGPETCKIFEKGDGEKVRRIVGKDLNVGPQEASEFGEGEIEEIQEQFFPASV